MTVDTFTLVDITNDKLLVDWTRHQNSFAWKGVLTSSQYVTRELVLGLCELTKDLRVFVLAANSNLDEKLCAVELLVRDAYIYRNGNRQLVKCGCIGGVYTYPDHRQKGYAKIMIDKLVENTKNGILKHGYIFLYSEVGDYYNRCGFTSMEVPVVVIDLQSVNNTVFDEEVVDVEVAEGRLTLIPFLGFSELMDLYKRENDRDIEKLSKKDLKIHVTHVPSHDSIDWFHVRAKYVYSQLNGHEIDHESSNIFKDLDGIGQKTFGFKLSTGDEPIGFVAFTYDYSTDKNAIKIILIHVFEGYDQSLRFSLLDYVKQFAKFYGGFDKLEVWGSEFDDVKLESIGEVIPNSSVSAIQMFNEEDQKRLDLGELVWDNNSKLPWF